LVSVLFPAWVWAKSPEQSFILTSYSDSLSEELNMARRTLLASDWFQKTFPNTVRFSTDQNRREQYKNLRGGMAIATSTEGTLTGKGADYLLVDDLLSPQQSYSDLERINANRFFDSTLRSRLNDPVTGRIIIVCQRLHEADLVGHLEENEPGAWTSVNLAMEAEQDEEIAFPISGQVVRRKTGDLLHPQRWPKSWCEKQKRTLGRLVWSSQYQQRPSPLEGNLVKASDVRYFGGKNLLTGELDPQLPASFERTILSVDCSFKDLSTSDYVAIVVVGISGSRRYVRHIVNARLDLDGTENEIRAAHANYAPVSAVLVEDKANGSAVVKHLKDEIPGLVAVNPEGGKMSRMMAAAPEFQAHNWFFDRTGAWTNRAIDQLCSFPTAKNDDISDSISQAAIWLQSHTYELGLVGYLKELASGARQMVATVRERLRPKSASVSVDTKLPQARVEGNKGQRPKPEPCPLCSGPRIWVSHAIGVLVAHCNQDGSDDGVLSPGPEQIPPDRMHCGAPLQMASGMYRCQNCGKQWPSNVAPMTVNGVSRAQYAAMQTLDARIRRSFGRFG
jgi:predicted phage terminase large subunit-like protein